MIPMSQMKSENSSQSNNVKPKVVTKSSKQRFTLSLIVTCIVLLVGLKYVSEQMKTANLKKNMALARSKGNITSDVHIVEHIDFQCPACAFGAKLLKEYYDKNPDKMFVELKYHPLPMHKHSFLSVRYAECAARQGKFWAFQDILLDRQSEWSPLFDPKATFEEIAKKAGLDMQLLNSCTADPALEKFIQAELDQSTALGVKSTPTYFINDKMVVGAVELKKILDKHFDPLPIPVVNPIPSGAPPAGGETKKP